MPRLSYTSTKNKDQFYKVRIPITDDFFFFENGTKKYIFLDQREFEFFKEKNKKTEIEVVRLEPLIKEARESLVAENKSEDKSEKADFVNKLAFHILKKYAFGTKNKKHKEEIEVPAYFPLDMAEYLRSKGLTLKVKKPFCPEREFKEPWEAAAIEKSIKKTQKAYRKIEQILTESRIQRDDKLVYKNKTLTSEFLKSEVEKILIEEGMVNTEGIIISSGAQAAIPHHPGSGPIKAHETIVCDLFPVSQETGYFADMTRTYVKGAPHPQVQKMYDVVLEAQKAALALAKPGVDVSEIHEACCQIFLEAGFDVGEKGFTHSTGHGLGLDIHERPNISKGQKIVLKPGYVFTIEPGLYYPQYGGVRIEDVVYITENGPKNLTNYPKKFVIP